MSEISDSTSFLVSLTSFVRSASSSFFGLTPRPSAQSSSSGSNFDWSPEPSIQAARRSIDSFSSWVRCSLSAV